MEEERKDSKLNLIDVRKMLTLAGAGCIIVIFYLFIGKISILFHLIGRLLKAMSAIIIGFIIAFLLNPIVNRLRMRFRETFGKLMKNSTQNRINKLSDVLAVILAMLFFLAMIASFCWILIPALYESINKLYENIDLYSNNLEKFANKLARDNENIVNIFNTYMGDIEENLKSILQKRLLPNMDSIVKAISSGIVGGLKFILNFVIGIIAAVYLLISKDTFSAQGKKIIYAVFNRERGNKILNALDFTDAVFSGFINGKIVDSIIIGFICFIFCKIVDMPYAVLISVIIGVTNIIPFFGPFIGAIPSAILVLVESPKMCLVFIIFIIVLQQVDGNIIGPLILGDSIGLSSFWVLFAIIVGGNLFGFAGMVLGVPTFACVYALLTLLLRDGLNKNGLANDTQYFVALRGFDENGNPIRGPKKRFENSTEKAKRAKKLEQIQHSKELFEKVTHHESKEKSGDKNNNKK